MKKIIILVIIVFCFFSFSVKAGMMSPYFHVTVNENTVDGDDNFVFHVNDFSHDRYGNQFLNFSEDFNIQTANGSGSYYYSDTIGSNDSYYITQDPIPGWQSSIIVCTSDNPSITTEPVDNGILIHAYPYSNITCNFTNRKQSSKTPVLIIPGVLGTDIYKGTDLLWANSKMATGFDGFMDPLGFNSNLMPIDDSLVATDVIRKMIFNTSILKFKLYDYTDSLINQLTSSDMGYTEGKDLFTFPYDWRFGVSSSTVDQLAGQINYILTQTDAGKAAGKVNVIAHSTGGLLVKKYVMENPNDHHIGKAVFVGVPNLGAPQALKALVVGDDFGVFNLDPAEMKKIGQNMPVIYDLAPTQEYYNQSGSFLHLYNPLTSPIKDKDLNFAEAMQSLVGSGYASGQGVASSTDLHTADFDNYDLRNEGIDLYNIVGCKSGTLGKFTEWVNKNSAPTFNFPKVVSGDGTVPFASADSLQADTAKTFFVPEVEHSSLLSADGSRQEIVNLITGGTLSTSGKVLTRSEVANRPDLCELKGESLKIHSPLAIDIIDQDGNHSGPLTDGSIENSIPGADYEVWGDEKYVFLPTDSNQNYSISVAGTGSGAFTLDDESLSADVTTQTQVFSNLPVTPSLTGQVNLGGDSGQTTLSLKATPTSTPVIITPSSIVNAFQSQDLTPPVSTSTITGTMGQPGYYRSNVSVSLGATDPVVNNDSGQTSGVLKTVYSLDNSATTTYQSAISVTSEGAHTISFFSTDKAGNNEQPQTITFTIDKTAPEAVIQFSPVAKDIQFTGIDTISTTSKITVLDNINDILLTDQAGNTTDIKLKEKNRKVSMSSTIQSLSYNGTSQDISKNILAFLWAYNKNNNLTLLSQSVAAKKTYLILAVYNGTKTSLVGIDKTGIILKAIAGLDLLKVTSNKGDLGWSY